MLRDMALASGAAWQGNVLVECTWDNPHFWYRYSLMRTALGFARGHEIGILGPHQTKVCRDTCARLGMAATIEHARLHGESERAALRDMAGKAVAGFSRPDDVLDMLLPYGVQADIVLYDGLLKRQHSAVVDLQHSELQAHLTEAYASIEQANRLLEQTRPSLVLLSHASNFFSASMGVIAASRGIPVVLLFGQFGMQRFVKVNCPNDIYDFMDRPGGVQIDRLPSGKAECLRQTGQAYLENRLGGKFDDVGSRYAYTRRQQRIDRAGICERFGFDPTKPVIGVYAANWFDFPHTFGMSNFRDFLDWLQVTLRIAVQNTNVNWLFKAHPCDEWYGGVTLKNLMEAEPATNVRQMPIEWNGADLIASLDGLVACHSTAGIEFAAYGKPVLLADKGWYHEAGIAVYSKSREDYILNLQRNWWQDLNLASVSQRAQIFAGWYFGYPDWQRNLILRDDSFGQGLWQDVVRYLGYGDEVKREVALLADWYAAPVRRYHTYKMERAKSYLHSGSV